jgi:hypothetical protein
MPKIYEYLGMIFFFYANEHLPIHVHISKAELESKAELIIIDGKLVKVNFVKVKGRKPLNENQLKDASVFIKKYYSGIIDKWTTFFVMNKKVYCEIINKKIK